MWWWHHSGWAWAWMSVMMVAFWTIVIVAVVWVVRASSNPQDGGFAARRRPQSAAEILAERYARGEIDSEEYRSRLDEIEAHTRS